MTSTNAGNEPDLVAKCRRWSGRRWLLVILAFLATLPLVFSDPYDLLKLKVLFGPEYAQVLYEPEQVTVYRLDQRPFQFDGEAINLQKDGSQPVTLSPAWVRKFRRALASPGPFGYFRAVKACGPHADIGIEFRRGDQTLHALLCFGCRELSLAPPDRLDWKSFPVEEPGRVVRELYPDFQR